MKIYTKTGDKGETGIIGKRVKKNSVTIETLGTLDEFNASIGVVVAHFNNEMKKKNLTSKAKVAYYEFSEYLQGIQSDIFSIGAVIAGGKIETDFDEKTRVIESEIDKMEENLAPLINFIIPGGTLLSSFIHSSRTICRKAERYFVNYEFMLTNEELYTDQLEMSKFRNIMKYLNRLSDYLFVLARFINKLESIEDVLWRTKPEALDLFSTTE